MQFDSVRAFRANLKQALDFAEHDDCIVLRNSSVFVLRAKPAKVEYKYDRNGHRLNDAGHCLQKNCRNK